MLQINHSKHRYHNLILTLNAIKKLRQTFSDESLTRSQNTSDERLLTLSVALDDYFIKSFM